MLMCRSGSLVIFYWKNQYIRLVSNNATESVIYTDMKWDAICP